MPMQKIPIGGLQIFSKAALVPNDCVNLQHSG